MGVETWWVGAFAANLLAGGERRGRFVGGRALRPAALARVLEFNAGPRDEFDLRRPIGPAIFAAAIARTARRRAGLLIGQAD